MLSRLMSTPSPLKMLVVACERTELTAAETAAAVVPLKPSAEETVEPTPAPPTAAPAAI